MAVTERPADVVGIDLGTTHCAAAFVEGASIAAGEPVVQSFPIPQLVREGELEERPVLPSCVYLAREGELPPGSLALPWEPPAADEAVGTLALELGGRVPGRLVTSAKSWLCHAQVDRTQAILPWGGSGERRLSPVEASARYLDHVRRAWNHARAAADPAARLEAQEVVLTVPASFDEAAATVSSRASSTSPCSRSPRRPSTPGSTAAAGPGRTRCARTRCCSSSTSAAARPTSAWCAWARRATASRPSSASPSAAT